VVRGHLLGHPVEKFNFFIEMCDHIRIGQRPISGKSNGRHGAREVRGDGQALVELAV